MVNVRLIVLISRVRFRSRRVVRLCRSRCRWLSSVVVLMS